MLKEYPVLITGGAGYIGSHVCLGFLSHGYDLIVVSDSVQDPIKYYKNNVEGANTLIDDCVNTGVGKFIFSSSAAVYGKLGKKMTHLIHRVCECLFNEEDELVIYGTDYDTPDGTCIRDHIHVYDLASAHRTVLEKMFSSSRLFCANVGNGKGYFVQEIINAAQDVTGQKMRVSAGPRREGNPTELVADPSFLKENTDWFPQFDDISLIIEFALNWEKARRYG